MQINRRIKRKTKKGRIRIYTIEVDRNFGEDNFLSFDLRTV